MRLTVQTRKTSIKHIGKVCERKFAEGGEWRQRAGVGQMSTGNSAEGGMRLTNIQREKKDPREIFNKKESRLLKRIVSIYFNFLYSFEEVQVVRVKK